MQGKIIKGIAGFYYVHIAGHGIYECKAKGVFRKNHEKPLVGDNVTLDVLDEKTKEGNITEILPRQNELIRPAVANVDQALVIFAATKPEPNFNLLDRFLLMMHQKEIPCIICFNKDDLIDVKKQEQIMAIYEKAECPILFASAKEDRGITKIRECLKGKTTTVAGPSGVGKSSIINKLQKEVKMQTGEISNKIERGKHTTRHSELITVEEDTYILDTPGFSSLAVFDCEKEEVKKFYPDFVEYEPYCRFQGCNHVNEPDCEVKEAVSRGEINTLRYENYLQIYEECRTRKKY
ncbi:MAG: ribosome small subunit-dependent GTPase A [Lachnospiraceae bacterium]